MCPIMYRLLAREFVATMEAGNAADARRNVEVHDEYTNNPKSAQVTT